MAARNMLVMELRHLRVFVAVAEELNFTRAADRLDTAQSAVSASIRTLERELRTDLFERSTHWVALTPAGEALLPAARGVLEQVDAARDAVAAVRGGLRGRIVLGSMQAQAMRRLDIADLLRTFATDHPEVDVTVRHVSGSAQMADELRAGRLDLGFLSLPEGRHPGLRLLTLSREPLALACSPSHRLASRKRVDLKQLAGERFVDFPRGWAVRDLNDRTFERRGVQRTVAFEINDTATVLDFVRSGLGVATVQVSLPEPDDAIQLVPLAGVDAEFIISVALPTTRRMSAAAQAFADRVLEDHG
jgi:DNA-binding transcriptional LysR family regulator